MKKQISTIIAMLILVCSAMGILLYLHKEMQAERDFSEIRETVKDEFDLLSLHEKYPDVVGWIKIPKTKINYPVMRGERYLYRNIKYEYSDSGTPFVQDEWEDTDMNSLIYGHNMWVQHTMFNPLHDYEEKSFWKKHKKGIFYVVRDDLNGNLCVEKRSFKVSHVIKASIYDDYPWQTCMNQKSEKELKDYEKWCDKKCMYDTGISDLQGYGMVTLCTCSYHIAGHRHDGRLLVTGAVTKTSITQRK